MDGNYVNGLSQLQFKFEKLERDLETPLNMYNRKGPCLQFGIARKFTIMIGCVNMAGGMSYTFLKRKTANTNKYARLNVNIAGKFGGDLWTNIDVEKIIHFHSMIFISDS